MTRARAWAYFDTSVLIKNYIEESGSPHARALLRKYRFLSSTLAPLEVFSALCRRQAAGELEARDLSAIRSRIQEDRLYWKLVEVSSQVLSQAEELVQNTGLRTLDAIHVASVVTVHAAMALRIPFITADRHQKDVAERLALDIIWVG